MSRASKLPETGTTIFTVMSALAQKHDAINLSQGFPNFEGDPRLYQAVISAIQNGQNQYAPMQGLPQLRELILSGVNERYTAQWQMEDITITSGASQAIFTAIQALVHPGDEVVVFDPSYDCYKPAIHLAGGKVVSIPLQAPDFLPTQEQLKEAISDKTSMVLVNSPHNPTGQCWSEHEWQMLEDVIEGKDIVVLSDEVYEHLVFDDHQLISALVRPKLKDRVLACFSFGKSFHVTGWKIGYMIGSTELMKEFNKVHQYNVFCVHRPSQAGIAQFLEDQPDYFNSLSGFYQRKRDLLQEGLAKTDFKVFPCQGTYFQLVDYSDYSNEPDTVFAERLTKEKGVATIPISVFYDQPPEGQKCVRICFAKTEDVLEEALLRLV
jgi:methionine aminotransferase